MDISEIKQRLPITEVLSHYGLTPDKNRRLCCPFHDDHTPSLQVYPQTGTCYCFSASCKTHGKAIDQIDFIMFKEDCTKHEAIVKAQVLLDDQPQAASTGSPDYEALMRTFRANFKKSPQAKTYAEKRVLNPNVGIGYNAGGWPQLKHCLVFPLLNAAGKTVSLYGRSIYDKTGAKHFYLKDRQGLYPGYPASYKTRVILTESIIDCATLWQIEGIAKDYGLVAIYGTNGLTEEHLSALAGLNHLQEVILWLNADEAGDKATDKHARTLRALYPEIKISRVTMPEGEDINSLAQGHHNVKVFTSLLEDRTAFSFSSEKNQRVWAIRYLCCIRA